MNGRVSDGVLIPGVLTAGGVEEVEFGDSVAPGVVGS